MKYDESEGPTKADNGEADPAVVPREADVKNGGKVSGWTNPLGWTDAGDDDETVLFQLKSKIHHKHHNHNHNLVNTQSMSDLESMTEGQLV